MSPVFAMRLGLDLVAAGLLTFGLSYWWLGDVAHEIAGTFLLALVFVHNGFNRRWYGKAVRTSHGAAGLFNAGVIVVLAVAMTMLLVTSAMITTVLPDWIPSVAAFPVRQLHKLAAFWAFVVVAVHLGLRWPMIMGVARHLFSLGRPSRWRTVALRLTTLCIAIQGVRSFGTLGLATRLTMQVSLDWWNFDEAVLGFFLHCAAVAGLLIAGSHTTAQLLRAASGAAVAQRFDQQGQGR